MKFLRRLWWGFKDLAAWSLMACIAIVTMWLEGEDYDGKGP